MIFTGIDAVVLRGDLAERNLSIDLYPMTGASAGFLRRALQTEIDGPRRSSSAASDDAVAEAIRNYSRAEESLAGSSPAAPTSSPSPSPPKARGRHRAPSPPPSPPAPPSPSRTSLSSFAFRRWSGKSNVVDAVRLAPVHDLRPAIVAVAADGDAGRRPMAADRPDETAHVTAHLDAGGRLARPQDHGHRTAGRRIVDVDRQEAALVVVGIEERQLLVAVDHVDRVVDVEHDRLGRRGVAGAVEVDHHPAEPDEVAQSRRVLPARHGRLAHQVRPALRQPPAGELEGGVGAQGVEIVGVLVAAGDGEDAREQNLGERVNHPRRIAPIGDHGRELLGDPHPSRCRGEQHHAAVRRQAPAVERGGELLAPDGWKPERQSRIVGHGGCGRLDGVDRVGFNNRILRHINRLGYIRQPRRQAIMNKTG